MAAPPGCPPLPSDEELPETTVKSPVRVPKRHRRERPWGRLEPGQDTGVPGSPRSQEGPSSLHGATPQTPTVDSQPPGRATSGCDPEPSGWWCALQPRTHRRPSLSRHHLEELPPGSSALGARPTNLQGAGPTNLRGAGPTNLWGAGPTNLWGARPRNLWECTGARAARPRPARSSHLLPCV